MATTINARLIHKRGTEASIPTLKDGQIYLCTDSDKIFKGTSIGENKLVGDIKSLINLLDRGYSEIAKDMNGVSYKQIKENGLYKNVGGTPTTGANGVLQVIANTDKWSVAYKWFDLSNANIVEYNSVKDGDSYSAWVKIATNKVTEIPLPLRSNVKEATNTNGYRNTITKKDDGTIIINFAINKADGSNIEPNEMIAIADIPIGYRIHSTFGVASGWGANIAGFTYVDTGNVLVAYSSTSASAIVGNLTGEAI